MSSPSGTSNRRQAVCCVPRSSPSLTVSARLRSGISALAFSPTGDRLFVGNLEGSLGCVNLVGGELETLSGEQDGRIWFLSFPRNGPTNRECQPDERAGPRC